MHHLAINHDWLEVTQLILGFTLLVFAAEKVNSFLNRITLHKKDSAINTIGLLLTFDTTIVSIERDLFEITLQQAPWVKGAMPYFREIFIHSK